MLKISAAAREMKDKGKDKAMAQTKRRRGGSGEGERRGEKETDRQREDGWGGQGYRENVQPQFTVLGQAGLRLDLVSIKRETESEKEKSYFFTLKSEK